MICKFKYAMRFGWPLPNIARVVYEMNVQNAAVYFGGVRSAPQHPRTGNSHDDCQPITLSIYKSYYSVVTAGFHQTVSRRARFDSVCVLYVCVFF